MKKYALLLTLAVLLLAQVVSAGVIAPQNIAIPADLLSGGKSNIRLVRWANIHAGDTCGEFSGIGLYFYKTLQISGTWGGAAINIEGSQDGNVWFQLHNMVSQNLQFTQNSYAITLENAAHWRWTITGGDETTVLKVDVLPFSSALTR